MLLLQLLLAWDDQGGRQSRRQGEGWPALVHSHPIPGNIRRRNRYMNIFYVREASNCRFRVYENFKKNISATDLFIHYVILWGAEEDT